MKAARGGPSQVRWIVLAAVVALTGWGIVVALGSSLSWRGSQFREDRELVRSELMVDDGVPVALPVELPAGYQVPNGYGYGWSPDGPIDSTSVSFPPTEKARRKDHLHYVDLCVEHADKPGDGCATDGGARTIVRTVDGARVVITLQDRSEANRLAWQTAPLTTELEKVAWLR